MPVEWLCGSTLPCLLSNGRRHPLFIVPRGLGTYGKKMRRFGVNWGSADLGRFGRTPSGSDPVHLWSVCPSTAPLRPPRSVALIWNDLLRLVGHSILVLFHASPWIKPTWKHRLGSIWRVFPSTWQKLGLIGLSHRSADPLLSPNGTSFLQGGLGLVCLHLAKVGLIWS